MRPGPDIKIRAPAEAEKSRRAGKLAAQVLDMISAHVVAGVRTEELDKICHDFIVGNLGVKPANLGYRGYPKTILTSVNHVVCHGIPAAKQLKNGDIVNIDVAVLDDGWFGDTSRMYCVGEPSVLARRLVRTTYDAMRAGIEVVRPGATLGDIGYAIQRVAQEAGFGVVREFCGHGIGDVYHDDPQILHYGSPGTGIVLKAGMIFTVEPMLNAGKAAIKQLSDGWTVVTKDHSLSAQWEHMVLVTESGFEVLTRWPDGCGDYPEIGGS
jgi:methionyl aminopeptidase